MSKRIDYSYGSGFGDVFLSLKNKRFFSVYGDNAALHELYDGKMYYTSRSGLSGAGFVRPTENDLVSLPVYRTDTAHIEFGNARETLGVEFAVPISGRALDPNGAIVIVLRDGGDNLPRLVFFPSRADLLVQLLAEGTGILEGEGWKKFCPYHNPPRQPDEHGWGTFRYTHYEWAEWYIKEKGAYEWCFQERELQVKYAGNTPERLHEYIGNFAQIRKDWGDDAPTPSPSKIDQAMGLQQFHSKWIRCGLFGFVKEWWDKNPRHTGSEEPVRHMTEWTTIGTHFAYKRNWEDKMYCVLERRRTDLEVSYATPNLPDLIEFERVINLAEFYVKGIDAVIAEMDVSLRDKARQDAQYAVHQASFDRARGFEATQLLEAMKTHADLLICTADSLETGNCQVGTDAFIARFGIQKDASGCTTLGALAGHEQVAVMLADYQFRKVIDHVLTKHGVTLAPQTSGVIRRVRKIASRIATGAMAQADPPAGASGEFVEIDEEDS